MHLNRHWIRSERERRAWSQEQLAAASGVGVRTIQRVESSGIASNETAMALAAVFECTLEVLRLQQPVPLRKRGCPRALAAGAVLALVAGGLLMVARQVQAGDFQLDIALAANQEHVKRFTLVVPEGMSGEARLEKELRVVLSPKQEKQGMIRLSAEIYRFDGREFVWFAGPSVIAREGEDATINLTNGDGKVYQITVRSSTT